MSLNSLTALSRGDPEGAKQFLVQVVIDRSYVLSTEELGASPQRGDESSFRGNSLGRGQGATEEEQQKPLVALHSLAS